jgi:NAD(P)-dependent dehydrogenase (short-subunit alcohol dehydrogenase family)
MTGRMSGKVVIVTGGARGQGAAHGRLLAREGAQVVLADVRDDDGESTATSLQSEGLDVAYTHLDVTSDAEWERVFTETGRKHDRVDVLVNNAGIVGSAASVAEETLDDWARVVAVNQTGVFLGLKHAVAAMCAIGGGSIINVSSIWGVAGAPERIAYQATKGAVMMMTRSAAITYAREGIRVNTVVPGSVQTQFGPDRPLRVRSNTVDMTPMGRRADPIEISYAVLYLASDESAFVTGADLVVDGGYLAQ